MQHSTAPMDVEPAATEPRTPAADSRTPAAEPRTPDADSRMPDAESRTRAADDVAKVSGIDTQASEAAEEDDGSDGDEGSQPEDATEVPVLSATALLSYCADDALSVDLPEGQLGPICRTMAVDLDAGAGTWFRCGVYGDGRCAIAAYLQASGASPSARVTSGRVQGWGSAGQTRNRIDCDDWRPLMKGWIAQLSGSALHRLQQVVLHVGNSGFDNRGADIPGEHAEQRNANRRRQAWQQLLDHLDRPNASLGWDYLAALSQWKGINILLYTRMHVLHTFAAGSKPAIGRWADAHKEGRAAAEARRQGKRQPDGTWTESNWGVSPVLVPSRVREEWPFMCMYQRTENHTSTPPWSQSRRLRCTQAVVVTTRRCWPAARGLSHHLMPGKASEGCSFRDTRCTLTSSESPPASSLAPTTTWPEPEWPRTTTVSSASSSSSR